MKKQRGDQAEKKALEYLSNNGLKLISKNYHCPFGEIDLIMQDKTHVAFIEVRMRTNVYFGTPIESVNYAKQQKIFKCANHFLQMKGWLYKVNCRFDIVGIRSLYEKSEIEWLKNAF